VKANIWLQVPSGAAKRPYSISRFNRRSERRKYFFLGENVAGYSERKRANLRKNNIGFVFQSFNLIDELTVAENVELPLLYLGLSSGERKKRVDAVLERMQLTGRRNHFPKKTHGGQQQRYEPERLLSSRTDLGLARPTVTSILHMV
jgi:putative ABC transport system ATP-binding protein